MVSRTLDCKVYIGDLGNNAREKDVEEAFNYYGPLRSVWVARRPPGFAFVEFEDPQDAEDAVRSMDGKTLCGRRVCVQLSNGRSRWPTPNGLPPPHILRKPAPRWLPDGIPIRYQRGGVRDEDYHKWNDRPITRSRPPPPLSPRTPSRSISRSRSRSRCRHRRHHCRCCSHSPSYSKSRSKSPVKKDDKAKSKSPT